MTRYKRLNLSPWLKAIFDPEEDYLSEDEKKWALEELIEITPVFNRDGEYIDRLQKKYWFEYAGKAYYSREDNKSQYHLFKHELSLTPRDELLHPEVENALLTLKKWNRLDKKQKQILELNEQKKRLRNARRAC